MAKSFYFSIQSWMLEEMELPTCIVLVTSTSPMNSLTAAHTGCFFCARTCLNPKNHYAREKWTVIWYIC